MDTLTDPIFWLALGTLVGLVAATALVTVALRYVVLKVAHWLAAEIIAVAPAPYGRWVVGIVRFFYVAALFCGFTAFVIGLLIWGVPWPPRLADRVFFNPLFWLTWLAVMAAIMFAGIAAAVILRVTLARLWAMAARKWPALSK